MYSCLKNRGISLVLSKKSIEICAKEAPDPREISKRIKLILFTELSFLKSFDKKVYIFALTIFVLLEYKAIKGIQLNIPTMSATLTMSTMEMLLTTIRRSTTRLR